MAYGGIYISDAELADIHNANERERSKLELRIERLEDTLAHERSVMKKGLPGDYVRRSDFEKLQEQFDELFDLFNELTGKCAEMALAADLDFDKLGTNPKDEM